MNKSINVINIDSGNTHTVDLAIPDYCPICHKALYPQILKGFYVHSNGVRKAFIIFFCGGCEGVFIGSYYLSNTDICQLISIDPHVLKQCDFPDKISNLSPDFITIYNEAYQAEQSGLKNICGAGYRKALEFLIKDFATSQHPDKKDRIEAQTLSQCINEFIDNNRIKTLATASTWIGNDEVHYSRKHPDYDVESLKSFLNTAVAYVNMELNYLASKDLIDGKSQQ